MNNEDIAAASHKKKLHGSEIFVGMVISRKIKPRSGGIFQKH
jgi:hypothetical protein